MSTISPCRSEWKCGCKGLYLCNSLDCQMHFLVSSSFKNNSITKNRKPHSQRFLKVPLATENPYQRIQFKAPPHPSSSGQCNQGWIPNRIPQTPTFSLFARRWQALSTNWSINFRKQNWGTPLLQKPLTALEWKWRAPSTSEKSTEPNPIFKSQYTH